MPPRLPTLKATAVNSLAFTLRIAEPLGLWLAGYAAYVLRHHELLLPTDYLIAMTLAALGFVAFSILCGTYRADKLRKLSSQLPGVFAALALTMAVVLVLMFGFKSSAGFSRLWVIYWVGLNAVGLMAMRALAAQYVRRQIKQGKWQRRIAVYGFTRKTEEMLALAPKARQTGIVLSGIYAEFAKGEHADFAKTGVYKGGLEALMRDGLADKFDDVIIAEDITQMDSSEDLLTLLHKLPVNVFYCLPVALFGRVQSYELIPGVPLVLLYHRPLDGHHLWLKRGVDVVVSGGALLCLAPLVGVLAILVKLSSPGPVFFRQKRNGFNGSEFEMLKFRSMRIGAANVNDASGKEKQAGRDDPRITPIGKFLRRSSLDELPQLINVLRGDMSLVGPRPHVPSHNTYYETLIDRYASRHKMKPGLTGWAQVNGWRGETETIEKMAKRVEYDIWYAEHWSLSLDLKIIFLTPLVLFFQKQAY